MSGKHSMRASNFSGFLCHNLNENTLVSFSSSRRSPYLGCPWLVPHAGSFPLVPGIPGHGTSRIPVTPPLPSAGGAGPIHGARGRNARWLVIGAVRHARAGRGLACRRCRVTAAPGNGGGAAPRWGGTGAAGPTPLLGTGGWWAGGGVCGGALFGLGVREKVCVGSFVWRVCAERGEGT